MGREIIFVADDFGLNTEVNDAIVHAHRHGRLDGASLMMGQPGTDDAVRLARENPRLQIGWHLHLNDSDPAIVERWPWGDSPALAGFAISLSSHAWNLARLEIAQQWRLFRRTGLECRFINSHHHLHAHPYIYQAVVETVGPLFPGWIRLGRARGFGPSGAPLLWSALDLLYLHRRRRLSPWRHTDTLWGLDRPFEMNAPEVESALAALPDGFHEFMFHPRSRSSHDTVCLQHFEAPSALA
jgi:predicted glycoside hydrolase/deacetylase ChbG (UPF0249 family)